MSSDEVRATLGAYVDALVVGGDFSRFYTDDVEAYMPLQDLSAQLGVPVGAQSGAHS